MSEKKNDVKVDKSSAKKKSKIKGFFNKIGKFFRDCKSEVKKITWTAPKQVTKNFAVVLVVIIVLGLFIFALDRGLYALLGLIMNISAT